MNHVKMVLRLNDFLQMVRGMVSRMDSTKNGNLLDGGFKSNMNLREIAGLFRIVR